MIQISLSKEAETLALGRCLGERLQPGQVVFLSGQLGTGKTTLARGILAGLGYHEAVRSPTYTLVETYETDKALICHFDLYRVKDSNELEAIGVRDYLAADTICLIEWPERGGALLPPPTLHCTLETAGQGRCICLSGRESDLWKELEAAFR